MNSYILITPSRLKYDDYPVPTQLPDVCVDSLSQRGMKNYVIVWTPTGRKRN